MYTVDTALDSLRKYDIHESDLIGWERDLALDIAVDSYGRKQYSPHHINLFKNIKKHLALGRTIQEIRKIIDLPPLSESHPNGQTAAQSQPIIKALSPEVPEVQFKPNASAPKMPNLRKTAAISEPVSTFSAALLSKSDVINPTGSRLITPTMTETTASNLSSSQSAIIEPTYNDSDLTPPITYSMPEESAIETEADDQLQVAIAIAMGEAAHTSEVNQNELITDIPISDLTASPESKGYTAIMPNTTQNISYQTGSGMTTDAFPTTKSRPDSAIEIPPELDLGSPAIIDKSAYASVGNPTAARKKANANAGAANVINLVQRLTREKDQLYKKLLETEKLNSHLYSANNLFHKKVRDMTRQIVDLRESMDENEKFKLMDDKARLHKQLLETEKLSALRQEEKTAQILENGRLKEQMQELGQKIQSLSVQFNAEHFRGDWMENGKLVDVIYDNFGINIDPERLRLFRISEKPQRCYGDMAIINTSYQYESNNLWKRDETLTVSYVDENTLEGELTAEYVLDGVPVAKALYRIVCTRHNR